MDKDGTLKIDWNEWRNYLILSPSANLDEILHYWRHASVGALPSLSPFPSLSPLPSLTLVCQYCLARVHRVLHAASQLCYSTVCSYVGGVTWAMHRDDCDWSVGYRPFGFDHSDGGIPDLPEPPLVIQNNSLRSHISKVGICYIFIYQFCTFSFAFLLLRFFSFEVRS